MSLRRAHKRLDKALVALRKQILVTLKLNSAYDQAAKSFDTALKAARKLCDKKE